MKNILKISYLTMLLVFSTVIFSNAQKFGHLNSGNLLVEMPATKTADDALKTYRDGLIADGEKQAKAFQTEYEAFVKAYQGGTIPPKEAQLKQQELQTKQQALVALEQEVINKVAQKREELFKPILDKVQVAIDAVGKEGGYTFIFDTSIPNTLVFVDESVDLTAMIKAKLGM